MPAPFVQSLPFCMATFVTVHICSTLLHNLYPEPAFLLAEANDTSTNGQLFLCTQWACPAATTFLAQELAAAQTRFETEKAELSAQVKKLALDCAEWERKDQVEYAGWTSCGVVFNVKCDRLVRGQCHVLLV